jgi:hypothetical protein
VGDGMARQTKVEYVCDLCARTDAGSWLIEDPTKRRVRVDLCPRHAEPLKKAFNAGREPRAGQGHNAIPMVEDYDG